MSKPTDSDLWALFVNISIFPRAPCLEGGQLFGQVGRAAGVAPLVVVPHGHLRHVAVNHHRVSAVEYRTGGVVYDVGRYDGIGDLLTNQEIWTNDFCVVIRVIR